MMMKQLVSSGRINNLRVYAKQNSRAFSLSHSIFGENVHGFILRNNPLYRVFIEENSKKISPWHDIALFPDASKRTIVNFVNEIPKHSCEKMEIATKEEFNPIKQDIKKDKLRLYPFASLVNYGCLPQTWENPEETSFGLQYKGDNDPIDVVEVGGRVSFTGEVYPVKVLGVLGMIDEGEMDWKVVAIDVNDPKAGSINNLDDLEKVQPGKVKKIIDWFKSYKVPDGKPLNSFAFEEKGLSVEDAIKVITETNKHWADKTALTKQGLWVK